MLFKQMPFKHVVIAHYSKLYAEAVLHCLTAINTFALCCRLALGLRSLLGLAELESPGCFGPHRYAIAVFFRLHEAALLIKVP